MFYYLLAFYYVKIILPRMTYGISVDPNKWQQHCIVYIDLSCCWWTKMLTDIFGCYWCQNRLPNIVGSLINRKIIIVIEAESFYKILLRACWNYKAIDNALQWLELNSKKKEKWRWYNNLRYTNIIKQTFKYKNQIESV